MDGGGAFDGKVCLILFVSEVDVLRFPDVVVELVSASGGVGRLGEVLSDVSSCVPGKDQKLFN